MGEELNKTLSFPVLLLIAINSIMGTGIFFLPAIGAAEAGVVSIISWLILSIVSIYIAMCFAELASMFPTSGGVYEYCKQAFGEFPSFLVGWGTLVAGNITIAMLIVGAVRYLNPALPDMIKISVSIVFLLAFNFVAYKGMDTSKVMLVTFSIITLGSLALIIFPALFSINTSNYTPFATHSFSAVLVAIFLIAETFFGWETITFLAEETKNPRKSIPKALVMGTVIMTLIAMLYVVSAIGSVGWKIFGSMKAPLADLANIFYGASSTPYFSILVYLSIIGSVAGWIVSTPRLILALAKDKLFIAQLAEVHPVNKTPHKAILFQTILTIILVVIGSGSYENLLSLLIPLVMILYSCVLLSLVVLRRKRKDLERGFKAPLGNFLPLVVIAMILALIGIWIGTVHNAIGIFRTMLSFLLLGIPIYLLLIFFHNPDAIVRITNSISRLTLILENFMLPKKIRKEILKIFQGLKHKKILEFGCGVGTLTMQLAEEVGPEGRIYATDISKNNINILKKRMKDAGHRQVLAIHDRHQVNRVHPDVKYADIVFSVGMLSYLQDVTKVLKDINKLMPEHGKVCFVEYVDFFRLLPNPPWMKNLDNIKKHFREAGFSVYVDKKKGLFWNYLIVYGFKSEKDVPFV